MLKEGLSREYILNSLSVLVKHIPNSMENIFNDGRIIAPEFEELWIGIGFDEKSLKTALASPCDTSQIDAIAIALSKQKVLFIINNIHSIDKYVCNLDKLKWHRFLRYFLSSRVRSEIQDDKSYTDILFSKSISERAKEIFICMTIQPEGKDIIDIAGGIKFDSKLLQEALIDLVTSQSHNETKWEIWIEYLKKIYTDGVAISFNFRRRREFLENPIPLVHAKKICEAASSYPLGLLEYASRSLSEHANTAVESLKNASEREEWFSQLQNPN